MNSTFGRMIRRPRSYTSSLLVNQLSLKRPLVVTWWEAAFPGFGQMMLCRYVNGMLMMILELIINTKSHLNLSIYYTMIGKFHEATKVLDTRWFLAYAAIYVFALRDAYQKTVILNKHYLIAQGEGSPILPTRISTLEINCLDLRNPREAVMWSLICPGFGHLYINRLPSGFFLIAWYLLVCYKANLFPSVLATCSGDFAHAISIINPQWLLYIPSVVCFGANDSYLQCHALNATFRVEQSRFFKSYYQSNGFKMPTLRPRKGL